MSAILTGRLLKNGVPTSGVVKFFADANKTQFITQFATSYSGYVTCQGNGGTYYVQALDSTGTYSAEGWVSVNEGDAIDYGNVTLLQSPSQVIPSAASVAIINGSVINQAGQAVANAMVQLTDIHQAVLAQAQTNSSGAFSVQASVVAEQLAQIKVLTKSIVSSNANTRVRNQAITHKIESVVVS